MNGQTKRYQIQTGFTLVELLLIMVIVFVVGAVTLPRFTQAPDTTHSDRVTRTASDLQSAVLDIHALWLSQGQPDSVRNLDNRESAAIDTNATGYPVGIRDVDRITRAADCSHLWLNVLPNAPSAWHNTQPDPDYVALLEDGACRFHYRRAEGLSIVYQPRDGRVRVDAPS